MCKVINMIMSQRSTFIEKKDPGDHPMEDYIVEKNIIQIG